MIIDKIKNYCDENKITQKGLSDLSGISEISISRYFNRARIPSLEIITKIADGLGLTLILIEKGKPRQIKVWNKEEIINLIEKYDWVLYNSLIALYKCQTEEEKINGNTSEHNGIGFNAVDAPYLCAMFKSLNKYGHLTNGQKEKTRKIILKYSKQITMLANEHEKKKDLKRQIDELNGDNNENKYR